MFKLLLSPAGRMKRSEFWMIQIVIAAAITSTLFALSRFVDPTTGADSWHPYYIIYPGYPLLAWVNLTACINIGKSGFWILINFVPVLGAFMLYGEIGVRKGTEAANKYGAVVSD